MFDITLFFHYSVLQITQRCKIYAVNFNYLFSVIVHKEVWNVNKLVQHFWWIRTCFYLKGGSHIRRKYVSQSRLWKSACKKNSRLSNFIKGKFLIFQDCNLFHNPSTGLLCWYNTGFVWIKGEVLILANTHYCFKELAKVWFTRSPLSGWISNSYKCRWRFAYHIFKVTNTITITTPV